VFKCFVYRHDARRSYLDYSGNFEGFRPEGAIGYTNGGEIWMEVKFGVKE